MKKSNKKPQSVEGEGSYTATRAYNSDLEKSVKAGHSEELGEKARRALEGPEGPALREAEKAGKSGRSVPGSR